MTARYAAISAIPASVRWPGFFPAIRLTVASQSAADLLAPKINFGRDAQDQHVVDANGDGLVDVVYVSGTEVQTYFSLGRLPGGVIGGRNGG